MLSQLQRHAGALEVVVQGMCLGYKYLFDEDLGCLGLFYCTYFEMFAATVLIKLEGF